MKKLLHFFWGQTMILVIVFLALVLVISSLLFGNVSNFLRLGTRSTHGEQAAALADAGIDYAIYKLNATAGNWWGDALETQLGETGTYFVSVSEKAANLRIITSTGFIPNSTSPKAQRTTRVEAYIDGQVISFNFAVQTGTGGVSMANSATINGNAYSNGSITGSGSSQINGDAYSAGTISTPDPLVTGTKNPGASPRPLPSVDYQLWKDRALTGDTESTNCTISQDTSIGPKKYDCSLLITNNATVTLNGPVWVTGNFSMSQGGTTLKLNENFLSTGTAVIVDGTISLTQGGTLLPTSATPKGYILLATTSTLDPAISISQGGATALFYALEGGAELSQTADVVSLAAKKLTLKNSATLNYDSGLASVFTTGPGASWQIKKGTYKYTK